MKRTASLLMIFSALSAAAQKDTTALEPVEVRATRASATAPFAKTNLSKEEIRRQNLGQDLPFLLNQVPSVVINSDAGTGIGYTGIRIRGTDATRINVTLNGIPYNDAESQGTFFVNLPDFASSVNSIQVQRGVGTSTNGPSAFGATINISTHELNRKPYAEINNSFGSFNSLKNTLKAGTGLINGRFVADLRLSRITSDGYIDRASSNLKGLFFSTAYLAGNSDIRFNFFTGKEKTYQAWYGVSEADLKTNRRVNYAGTERPGEPYDNETDNYRQDHYQLFFTHRFSEFLTFNTGMFYTMGRGFYEQYKANRKYSDYNISAPAGGPSRTDLVRQLWLDNDFFGNTFTLQYKKNGTDLIFGGYASRYEGLHFGKVKWAQHGFTSNGNWYDNDAWKRDFNIYGKWQQQVAEGLQIFSDLQYRRVGYRIDGFRYNPSLDVDVRYNFLNPKLGLSYQQKNWLFYGSYSLGQKEPNRDDFEAGSILPRPEKLHDYELGIENRNTRRAFSANFYYMRYRDQLVLTGMINDVGAYTRTNIPNSYRLGVELQSVVQLNQWLRASANLSLSRNRILDFSEFIDDYDNNNQVKNFYSNTDIAFSPSVVGGYTFTVLPAAGLSFDLIGKYVSEQYLDNTSSRSRMLDAFFTKDLRAVYQVNRIKSAGIELLFQVNNVLNAMYAPNGYTFSYITGQQLVTENYYFPMAGRNFMVGLNVRIE